MSSSLYGIIFSHHISHGSESVQKNKAFKQKEDSLSRVITVIRFPISEFLKVNDAKQDF